MTFQPVDEVPVDPLRVRLYAEGWQSWSPTRCAGWGTGHRPEEPWQHTMRFRPGSPLDAGHLQAEGLLVVDPGTGEPSRTYSVVDASEEVASLRASLVGTRLVVTADGPVVATSSTGGVGPALTAFGEAFAARAGVGELAQPPTVWCSWYRYFEGVTAADIEENAAALEAHDLPVEVIQIDDGWSQGLGERLRPSPGFPDLPRLVDGLRSRNRRVGIWLAPFLVGVDTELARDHSDWLAGDGGRNWGQDLRGLDLTHPGVQELVTTAIHDLRALGIDYFKLDFLYAGAVPARRRQDVSATAAYRDGLRLIREAAGPEAYLVACGAPLLPSVGLVDAMRVSPDTFHEGGEDGSRGLRGRGSLMARAWQQGRFWVNDPDCLVVRPTYALREAWAETVRAYGGLRSCSDRVVELDPWGLETTRQLLEDGRPPLPFPDETVAAALADEVQQP